MKSYIKHLGYTLALSMACISTSSLAIDETDIFCGKTDRSDWYWLKNDNGQQVKANGDWDYIKLNIEGRYTYAFVISFQEYDKIKSLCNTDYVPQPADYWFNEWAIFAVSNDISKGYMAAPGSFDVITIPAARFFIPARPYNF